MIIIRAATVDTPEEEVDVPNPRPNDRGFGWVLIGADSSSWDLNAGPLELQPGVQGVGIPDPAHWRRETAAIDGATWQGLRTPSREVFLPTRLIGSSSDHFLEMDSSLSAVLDPEGLCTLVVVAPDASYRTLNMRYETGAEGDYEVDPMLMRRAAYPLTFHADDPWWHTPAIERQFAVGSSAAIFPGPPFIIAPSNLTEAASIVNPGERPVYPRWRVNGPCTAFSLGVGSTTVDVTATLVAGEWIDIDMGSRSIVDHTGASRWVDATDADFAKIEPGEVPLEVSITGDGVGTSVDLTITPAYRRAW